MKSTGEVEALRMAEATAEAEGTMELASGSPSEVVCVTWRMVWGLGLGFWREEGEKA